MNYRMADKNDIEKLVNIRISYLKEDFGEISDESFKTICESLPEYFVKHLNNDIFAFIAENDDIVVSSAFLLIVEKPANPCFVTGKIGNVLNVYTVPGHRRKGSAGRLMDMLINFGREKNIDYIELKATDVGYPLYKKLGFVENVSSYTDMKFYF